MKKTNQQLTTKSFNKLYRKSLPDNVIDKNEYECVCKILTLNIWMKQKMIFFINLKINVKINFFSHNELELKSEPRI